MMFLIVAFVTRKAREGHTFTKSSRGLIMGVNGVAHALCPFGRAVITGIQKG